MKIAYLCNVYPHTTHSFIRREIHGLEQEEIQVERITIRQSEDSLPNDKDKAEFAKTFAVLERGFVRIIWEVLLTAFTRPLLFLAASSQAISFGIHSQAGFLRHLAYFAEACSVLRHLQRCGAQHVHSHFGTNATMVALIVRKLGGPPFSFMIHGPGEWDSPTLLHIPEKIAAASFVTVISDFARSQAYRWSDPEHWSKIHIVRCGVSKKFLNYSVSPVPDVPRLVMIARFGQSKGHMIMIEAVAKLLETGNEVKVKLIGDGPFRNLIEKKIRECGLLDHFELDGWTDSDSVRNALLGARALVLPSFGEGLPVVIMEALALARPVISTKIAAIPELVEDGKSGWLISAGNVDQLVAACSEALKAPTDVLTDMGLAGRKAVLERHDARQEARELANLLAAKSGT